MTSKRQVSGRNPSLNRPGSSLSRLPNSSGTGGVAGTSISSAMSAAATGRLSPANSTASTSQTGTSCKSPRINSKSADQSLSGEARETNITVVVRCRGRNEREIKENSGVVVSTDGIKGKTVELSMGPNALSNKTYVFDKVFSPAADQIMIYDEVVAPILEETLSGFNCTVFAYGQTGTGKTYTMTGDISDLLPLSDDAGIIPRVLHSLFNRLESEEGEKSVKCSFIELYNEELRDLLSVEENVRLKIYDEKSQRGQQSTTMVQGMEEKFIENASKGIKLLREGSHKRQVAATKCNDLSSRSHTIFAITVYMKRPMVHGEDFLSIGKLNLVDLAGSENIQRSGAENKRAAEAGLINKSLLTLGRVINALVEKSNHVPYRESKLTRLLQDSLGGQTKTCIIATLSPARSNLEETISTLDYAFRAKNIRNTPQVNQALSKKTLLREFTMEIEKLKSELVATRQKNGVYLTTEGYEEIVAESESRRILCEEQRDKIGTLEINLRNKVQELFSLTKNYNGLKREHETSKISLDNVKTLLRANEGLLEQTRRSLNEEKMISFAHKDTEDALATANESLKEMLVKAKGEIKELTGRLNKSVEVNQANSAVWSEARELIDDNTRKIESSLLAVKEDHVNLLGNLSEKVNGLISKYIEGLDATKAKFKQTNGSLNQLIRDASEQTDESHNGISLVLEEVKCLKDRTNTEIEQGLSQLTFAAEKISRDVQNDIETLNRTLQSSYAQFEHNLKGIFDNIYSSYAQQANLVKSLHDDLVQANERLIQQTRSYEGDVESLVQNESARALEDKKILIDQLNQLISRQWDSREKRLANYLQNVHDNVNVCHGDYESYHERYAKGIQLWNDKSADFERVLNESRDYCDKLISCDVKSVLQLTRSLESSTNSIHESTMDIVNNQREYMNTQLTSLDDIFQRITHCNTSYHTTHTNSLSQLAQTAKLTGSSFNSHISSTQSNLNSLGQSIHSSESMLIKSLSQLGTDDAIQSSLQGIRSSLLEKSFHDAQLNDIEATGSSPTHDSFDVSSLHVPRTLPRETLLGRMRDHRSSPYVNINTQFNQMLSTADSSLPSINSLEGNSKDAKIFQDDISTAQKSHLSLPTEFNTSSMESPVVPFKKPSTNSLGSNNALGGVSSGSLKELDVNVVGQTGNSESRVTSSIVGAGETDSIYCKHRALVGNSGGVKRTIKSTLPRITESRTEKLPRTKKVRLTIIDNSLDSENILVSPKPK